jgi:ABC-type uncharacterized transport system auxiliary subunit
MMTKGILLLAVAVLLAGGCAGPYYFDLQADVPARRGMTQVDKVLRIDRITISETYRDYRIVVRESPFRVKYAWFASWSRSPDELIGDAVLRFFGKRSVFRKVETIESGDDHDLEMRIRVEAIEKCLVGRRWHARLALDVEIVDPESGALLLGHSFDRRERLEGKKTRLVPGKIAMILHEELLKIEGRLLKTGSGS